MKIKPQRIHELLIKYRENRCNREEYEELIHLAQMSGNDQVIKEVMRLDWAGQGWEESSERESWPKEDRKPWKSILKVAASIAILITAGYILFQWFSSDPLTYATGNGEVMEITLPDGSEVTLNANSTLTWIMANNNEDRVVELTGEGFFEVTKEKLNADNQEDYRGFQVRTSKMTIHVLGTAFNVASRADNTEVFLQEGSVELELADQQQESRLMIPGDKVTMNNHTGTVSERRSEDILTSASWVTGVLNYHDKSMMEVLQNLSELFGVEISCEDGDLMTKKINLGVPYMDWDNTRKALEMAIEVEFRKEDEKYTVIQSNKSNN